MHHFNIVDLPNLEKDFWLLYAITIESQFKCHSHLLKLMMELLSMSNKLTEICVNLVYIWAFLTKTNLHTTHYILILMSYLVWILCFGYSQSVGWADTLSKCVGACHHTKHECRLRTYGTHFFFLRLIFSIQIIKCMLSRLCPRMDGVGRLSSVSWISVMTSQISDINCTTFSLFVT